MDVDTVLGSECAKQEIAIATNRNTLTLEGMCDP